MKNFIKKFKKWIIGLFIIAGASAAILIGSPEIPCIDDSTKSINERIVNCPISDAKEKANLKGRTIAKIGSIQRVLHGKYEIEITGLNLIEGGVEFYVRAWQDGVPVGLGVGKKFEKEHFKIFNPPILVDDPNGTIIRTWKDTITKEVKTRTLREDPREALLQVVEHNIKVTGKKGTAIIGSIGNTTDTFSPDAGDPGTDTVDGTLFVSKGVGAGLAWATMRGTGNTDISAYNAPANYNFKIFAIALTTTAQVQNVVQLHNGGEAETEFWRYALQAPTAGIAGANIAVSPPSYIFATGTSTTLAIQADASSLIHYSISFIK